MNDLVRVEQHLPQTAASIRAQVNLIQEVMQAVMKEGTHYGKIPGTPKPSLWKPGAEVLGTTFHIAPSYRAEDLSGPDFIRYRVTCIGTHQATSVVMGEGMGECSSMEEKYKWRKATSNREFDAAPEDRRRIKYGYDKQERREYEIKQVRAESADQANTILKMACKRAQVAMTLNVVAASDIFTQDIEDLPPELQPDDEGAETKRATVQQPKSKSAAPASPAASSAPPAGTATGAAPDQNGKGPLDGQPMKPSQCNIVRAKLKHAGLTEVDLAAAFPGKCFEPTESMTQFTFGQFAELQSWISENAKG